jgi:hypothetical protein
MFIVLDSTAHLSYVEVRWDVEAEPFGGLEVDSELELGRPDDRQVDHAELAPIM